MEKRSKKWLAIGGAALAALAAQRLGKTSRFTQRVQKLAGVPRTGSVPALGVLAAGIAPSRHFPVAVLAKPIHRAARWASKLTDGKPLHVSSMREIVAHEVAHQTRAGRKEFGQQVKKLIRAARLEQAAKKAGRPELARRIVKRGTRLHHGVFGHAPLFGSSRRHIIKEMKRTGLWGEMRKAGYSYARYERKLAPNFASDYIRALRALSRKHAKDDEGEVKKCLRLLKSMSREAFIAGRGEVWIPQPDRVGYYPIIEKVPYAMVRRATRKNTSQRERDRAWGTVARSAEPFRPLFAQRPGSLNAAQRRKLLAHAMVSLPLVKGRYPALLGKKVPGELGMEKTGSIIPIRRMDPAEFTGFQPMRFALGRATWKQVMKKVRSARAKRIMHRETRRATLRAMSPAERLKRGARRATIAGGIIGATVPGPVGGILGHRRKMKERVGLKKPLGVGGHVLRVAVGGGPYYIGRGIAAGREKVPKEWRKKAAAAKQRLVKRKKQQYTDYEIQCYEDGFQEWWRRAKWRGKRTWRWAKQKALGGALPAMARGATLGAGTLVATEIGMPRTTVDMVPITAVGLRKEFRDLSNMELMGLVDNLQRWAPAQAAPVRDAAQKKIADMLIEVRSRRGVM